MEIWKGVTTRDCKYDVIRAFNNYAMMRQISESVAVNRVAPEETMNSKGEWNQPQITLGRH